MAVLAAVFILLAIISGMTQDGYIVPTLIVVAYIALYLIVSMLMKYKSSYQLRMSQFLLSVLCRAENNKIYLKNGIEVRPGFLASWIEFKILETEDLNELIQVMRSRFLKQNLNQKV